MHRILLEHSERQNEVDIPRRDWVRNAKFPTRDDLKSYFDTPHECEIRVIYLDSSDNGARMYLLNAST